MYPAYWRYPNGQQIMLSNVDMYNTQTPAPTQNFHYQQPPIPKNLENIGPRIPNPLASPRNSPSPESLRIQRKEENIEKKRRSEKEPCDLDEFLVEYDLNRSVHGEFIGVIFRKRM